MASQGAGRLLPYNSAPLFSPFLPAASFSPLSIAAIITAIPPLPACPPRLLPPPRVPGRPQSPLRGTRAEPKTGTKESRAARTHRPPSLRRTERTQRPPHPDRLREGRREPPRRGSGKEREAEAEAEAEADSAPAGLRQHRGGRRSAALLRFASLRSAPLRPSATSSDPLSDAYRPRALLFKHSGPRDWPGG